MEGNCVWVTMVVVQVATQFLPIYSALVGGRERHHRHGMMQPVVNRLSVVRDMRSRDIPTGGYNPTVVVTSRRVGSFSKREDILHIMDCPVVVAGTDDTI